MIVEPKNSQIEEKLFAPLVMVKNGVSTRLFSDGLIDLKLVKKLQLPNARYDYLLNATSFSVDANGVKRVYGSKCFYIDKKQTEIEFNQETSLFVYLEADLITTEI